MDGMMKECVKPHALLHTLTGAGLGMVLLGLMPGLTGNAMMLGVLLVVAGMVGEFMGGNPSKKK